MPFAFSKFFSNHMTTVLSLFLRVSVLLGIVACEKTPHIVDITLSESKVELKKGESTLVKIQSGNGGYTVRVSDENVARVSISGITLSIFALDVGSSVITIIDEKKQTLNILLKVSDKMMSSNPVSSLYYSYNSSKDGTYTVYVNIQDSLYSMFNIVHQVDENMNRNLWRVMDSYLAIYEKGKMNKSTQILTAGENEFVWLSSRKGVTEFTGGFHGNERIDVLDNSFAKFYADGIELSHSTSTDLIPCSSFNYHQVSTMHQTGTGGLITSPAYNPVKGLPIECLHEKKTFFGSKGFTTENKVTWQDNNTPIKQVYYGIFCVGKDVSKYGYNDMGDENPEIIEFITDGQFKLKADKQRVVMFNEEMNISIICDSKVNRGGPFSLNTSVWDVSVYNKYYSAIRNKEPIQTTKGEVWETSATIKFDLYMQ